MMEEQIQENATVESEETQVEQNVESQDVQSNDSEGQPKEPSYEPTHPDMKWYIVHTFSGFEQKA
ncbi:MAG: hypothetical protein KDD46_08540, partial [Bdellovibrionales bacterium]|nr:hypothetical protein [Bdellovibrionales bacterium]